MVWFGEGRNPAALFSALTDLVLAGAFSAPYPGAPAKSSRAAGTHNAQNTTDPPPPSPARSSFHAPRSCSNFAAPLSAVRASSFPRQRFSALQSAEPAEGDGGGIFLCRCHGMEESKGQTLKAKG